MDEDRGHEADLDQRGQDREQREADQRGDAARPALDVAREAAGLPREVKAQAERMQVPEHLERDRPHRALGDLREQELAQLGEERRRQPQRPVRDQQRKRHDQQRRFAVEAVDDLLQQQRDADVGDLRHHEARERRSHPPAVGPEVRQQAADRAPVAAHAVRRRGCRRRIRSTHPRSLAIQPGVRSNLGRPDAHGPALRVHLLRHSGFYGSLPPSDEWTISWIQ